MPARSSKPSPAGTFVRVVIAGLVIAVAVGTPSCQVASTLSQGELEVVKILKATGAAAVSALISVWLIGRVVEDIWIAWVGLLSGVMPASLAAAPTRLVVLALAHLGSGAVLFLTGLNLLRGGFGLASATWSLFGLSLVFAGLGLGLGGAVPRLWWGWRGGGVEQPDDTVSRHLLQFSWLALAALGLSSGLAETLPAMLDPAAGIPLRRGDWERGCASTLPATQDICPQAQPYIVHARRPERMRLEWTFSRRCQLVVEDGQRRSADELGAFLHLDVTPERPAHVTVVGLDSEGCHYQLRVRPDREGAP